MNSFEFNKVVGGLLGTVFVVFSISLASEAIFASPTPETPGYAIEAEEADAGATGGEAPAAKPIAELLASADADAGAAVFKKCTACHSGEKGGPNKVGPDLWDIVNRPIATHEGFSYSAGMKTFSEDGSVHWDFDHLNHFLTGPKAYVKGTSMGFAGIKKDDERANLIAYLRTLSDNPAPLPEADAAPAEEGAPAEDAAPAETPAEDAAPAETPAEDAAPAEAPAEQATPDEQAPAEPAPAEDATPEPAQ